MFWLSKLVQSSLLPSNCLALLAVLGLVALALRRRNLALWWAVHGAPYLEKMWAFAGEAGLDVARGRTDAQSPGVVKVMNQDVADMNAINIKGTPTFFVNAQPLTDFGPQQLYDLVAAEVAKVAGSPSS